jgi:hypothetical protein
MQPVIARHATGVGPAPAFVIDAAPAPRRTAAPRQCRRLHEALQINRQRKLFAAQAADQPGGGAEDFPGIAPPVESAVHFDDFIHGTKAPEQPGIFARGKEDNFRMRKTVAHLPDRRQREDHIANGLEADQQDIIHFGCHASGGYRGKPPTFGQPPASPGGHDSLPGNFFAASVADTRVPFKSGRH